MTRARWFGVHEPESAAKRWYGMTPGEYDAYMDELVRRANCWSLTGGGAHRFEPDSRCDLYCARCGAERLGFEHRGQQ